MAKKNGGQDLADMTSADAEETVVPDANGDKLVTLNAELDEAYTVRDTKRIVATAQAIAKLEKQIENAELEAKQNALKDITLEVKDAILAVVNEFVDGGKLEVAQGIWFDWDFGTNDQNVHLLKKVTRTTERKSNGGGGPSHKGYPKLAALMEECGDQACTMDQYEGMTFQEAHDSVTDGNKRFAIRTAQLKFAGHV